MVKRGEGDDRRTMPSAQKQQNGSAKKKKKSGSSTARQGTFKTKNGNDSNGADSDNKKPKYNAAKKKSEDALKMHATPPRKNKSPRKFCPSDKT